MNNEGYERRILLAFLISSVFIFISYYFMPKPQQVEVQPEQNLITNQVVTENLVSSIEMDKKAEIITNILSNNQLIVYVENLGGRIVDFYVDGKWNQSKAPIKLYWQSNDYYTGDLFFGELENLEKIKDRPVYKIVNSDINSISLETEFKYKGKKFIVNKQFKIEDNYKISYEVKIKNSSKEDLILDFDGKSFTISVSFGFANIEEKNAQAMLIADYYIDKKPKQVLKGGLFKKREHMSYINSPKWFSVHNSYFIALTKPEFSDYGTKFLLLKEEKFYSEIASGIELPVLKLSPSEEKSYKVELYVGPKDQYILGQMDKTYKKLFSWPAAFNWFMKPMEFGLYKLAHLIALLVKNWGVTIIILALVIKLILSPLSIQAAISIKKSNLLQPKLKRLQEKYKDDPNTLNQKVAELYRQEKVNPLGGCLPLLLQFPVFFVLYRVLSTSVELKGASFLWIKDLTMPDTLFKVSLPFFAFNFNLLPIIMTVVQIFQMRIQSLRNPGVAKEQQFINNYLLPIFFLFIFWSMPSGLVLYWTVQNLFSIVEQEIINMDKQVQL